MDNAAFCFDATLDGAFLESIYGDDYEHIQIVFEQFVEHAPAQMQDVAQAYEAGNIEGFRQQIHKLKPVFGYAGLTNLTNMAEVLEKKCSEISSLDEIAAGYNDFKNTFTASFPVIENELVRLKQQF
jgi:HPt (histidine-containing phosphotransfer) domain-containing protein